jgi:hypothetical protein
MTTTAWRLPLATLIIGVTGDVLLRGGMWRLGFAIWIVLIVTAALLLWRSMPRERRLLLVGLVAAALGLVLRDAPMLYVIDILALLCTGALVIWHGTGMRFSELTVLESVRAGLLAVTNTIGGAAGALRPAPALPSDPHRDVIDGGARNPVPIRSLLIGVVLALPPLLIVAALLASSDAVFEALLERIMRILAIDGLAHVAIVFALAWIAAGWLRASGGDVVGAGIRAPRSPGLSFASVAVGLYALIALLLLFLGTQARVLFGGESFLQETAGLTAAAYAREGFLQLIVAAGVVLGTLVVAEWLLSTEDANGRRRYRYAGALLVALVGTLLVSAAVRIWIYVREFGLSEDRTLASAVMVWVLATLVALALTTLRGRSARFAPVTLMVTVAWVALLNVVNPEGIIVRVNAARAAAGQEFDAAYHATLSADALTALRAAAPRLAAADCEQLRAALTTTWARRFAARRAAGDDGWQSSSVPLAQARAWHSDGATLPCTMAGGG